MATGAGLDLREIEGLSHTLRAAQVPNSGEGSQRSDILPFVRLGKEALRRLPRNPNRMLAPQTGANRVRFVAAYLEWLASHNRAAGAQDRLRDTVRFLNARAKVTTHRTSQPRKGLTSEQRERLLAVIDPSSSENPFKSEAVRYRNRAVVACLDQSGMRRGELAGLKIPDVDIRKLTIAIHRRPPDPQDPRREKPRTKTNARAVPIRQELEDILFDYISVWRRAERGTHRPPETLRSNRPGPDRGGPPLQAQAAGERESRPPAGPPRARRDVRMNLPGAATRTGTETPMPRTLGALATYLAEDRDFRGIGPAKAAALAAAFGEDLCAALDQKRPEVIAIFGEETATNAFATYELKSPEIELLEWLESPGGRTRGRDTHRDQNRPVLGP